MMHIDDYLSPPAQYPPANDMVTHRVHNEAEAQIERNERLDAVEPGLNQFRNLRKIHTAQLNDIYKRAGMVDHRIDKLNDNVEKLRQQWGEIEREKEALLSSKENYEQKIVAHRKIVHKDDVKALKYHKYITLASEILVLDDSDEDEDDDDLIYNWGAQGRGEGEAEGEGAGAGEGEDGDEDEHEQ